MCPSESKPRYEVHSITGYPITNSRARAADGRARTTYWIADTEDCYREVPMLPISNAKPSLRTSVRTTHHRVIAERNCARLNAEDRVDAA